VHCASMRALCLHACIVPCVHCACMRALFHACILLACVHFASMRALCLHACILLACMHGASMRALCLHACIVLPRVHFTSLYPQSADARLGVGLSKQSAVMNKHAGAALAQVALAHVLCQKSNFKVGKFMCMSVTCVCVPHVCVCW